MGNVTIKGKGGGLEIHLSDKATYPTLREELLSQLRRNTALFKDTEMRIVIRGKPLSSAQRKELKRVFAVDFGIKDVLYGDEVDLRQQVERNIRAAAQMRRPSMEDEERETEAELVTKLEPGVRSAFIMDTVRNGQRVESPGDVVVIGDVNPGAEIMAGGSIAVFGKLRGLAHAGCYGDKDVCIAAISLSPKQIRIGGKVVSFTRDRGSQVPEVAKLDRDGKLVIRPIGGARK